MEHGVCFTRPSQPSVRAGLAATDRGLPDASITTDPAMALSVAAAYADRVAHLAARGAQIIVLPEKMVGVTSDSADAVVKVLSDAARAAHATVIAGLSRNGVQPRRNMALVISQDGTLVLQYEKRYLVPMIETTFASGNALGLFAGPGGDSGVSPSARTSTSQRGHAPTASAAYAFGSARVGLCPGRLLAAFAIGLNGAIRPTRFGLLGIALLLASSVGLWIVGLFPRINVNGVPTEPPSHAVGAVLTFVSGTGHLIVSRRMAAD